MLLRSVFLVLVAGLPPIQPGRDSTTRPATQPATTSVATAPAGAGSRVVPFQPGIRIDWARRQVEVEATVILREGALELFACSPDSREHESIVRIEARPLFVFQALGLIGLTEGHPVRYDPETDRVEPARGDPVEIEVRYRVGRSVRTGPIERWMKPSGSDRPLDRLPWIFTGSET